MYNKIFRYLGISDETGLDDKYFSLSCVNVYTGSVLQTFLCYGCHRCVARIVIITVLLLIWKQLVKRSRSLLRITLSDEWNGQRRRRRLRGDDVIIRNRRANDKRNDKENRLESMQHLSLDTYNVVMRQFTTTTYPDLVEYPGRLMRHRSMFLFLIDQIELDRCIFKLL